MKEKQFSWFFIGLMVLGLALILAYALQLVQPEAVAPAGATTTPDSFLLPFPTMTPTTASGADGRMADREVNTPAASFTVPPPLTETAVVPPSLAPLTTPEAPAATPTVPAPRQRFGTIGGKQYLEPALAAGLPVGHFMNWHVEPDPPRVADVAFWHIVRLGPDDGVRSSWDDIDHVLANQPGAVWIIGNEPDVLVQDSLTPSTYARLYQELYTYIKSRDPTALVAIGGVAQPTPLRMAYLDRVLESYRDAYGESMPIDIWTVHAFILREEADSWGVGIPPGMDHAGARLYEISDHGDIDIFMQNLIDFRAWMAKRGYGDRPLAVTEFGIVMPHDYGYPPQKVAAFLTDTFDFLLSATNGTGYAPDGNRLVQWWSWFSLYEALDGYNTGNLYDPGTGALTPLGEAWAAYVNN